MPRPKNQSLTFQCSATVSRIKPVFYPTCGGRIAHPVTDVLDNSEPRTVNSEKRIQRENPCRVLAGALSLSGHACWRMMVFIPRARTRNRFAVWESLYIWGHHTPEPILVLLLTILAPILGNRSDYSQVERHDFEKKEGGGVQNRPGGSRKELLARARGDWLLGRLHLLHLRRQRGGVPSLHRDQASY